MIAISPLLLLLFFLIRITSKGPAIYWQERVGLGGRVFRICKLRSMSVDAEEWTGAVWAQENDPRVTRIGLKLRKYHLDELVQLWNIVRGEMSFVGPRPERPEIAQELSDEIPGYAHRMMVLPGVTGLAQVNLLPDQTVDCVRKKIELDLEYVFTAEPFLELRIVACTILKMVGIPREVATRVLGLTRNPEPIRLKFQPFVKEVLRPMIEPAAVKELAPKLVSVPQMRLGRIAYATDILSFDLPETKHELISSGPTKLSGRL